MKLSSRHIIAALALHLLLFGLLFSGVQCSRKAQPVNVIQGTLISANQLPKEGGAPKPEPQPQPQPPQPAPPPEAPPQPPKPDPAEVQKQQQEVQRKAQEQQRLLVQQQAEATKAEQKDAEHKAEVKKQADAEEVKRKADEQKKQAQADEEKRAEDLRKSALAEEQKRAADDKKKKDEQAKRDADARRQREAELSAALGAETEQRQGQEVSIWGTQLTAAIERVWIRPPGVDQTFKCVLAIRLSPTGEVLSAGISKPSGNPQFDNSAVRAVYKASPLPLPRDATVFQSGINIQFEPKS